MPHASTLARWLVLAVLAAGIAVAGWRATVAFETDAHNAPMRWGFDPTKPTGHSDTLPVFEALPAGYAIETVATALDRPVQLVALPDGRLLVAEQRGAVRVIDDGELEPEPLLTAPVYVPPNDPRELGLTGIAVDPDWPDRPFVYLYHTADNVRRTMIERVRIEDNKAVERKEIISWRARPSCCHIGGGIAFLADGTLLVAVGDHQRPLDAQDPSTPPGSVLHITRDAAAVAGDGIDGPVYAYGLRNPFDVAVDPSTGRALAGENGDAGQDAIIELQPGANYGWPGTGLRVPEEKIAGPMRFYNDALGLAGMTFYRGRTLRELDGRLLFCQYNGGGALRSLEIEDGGSVGSERVIAPGCTSDVAIGSDGFVYFLNYEAGTLYRISKP